MNVSLIIPTFNRAHLLKDLLQSISETVHRPLEVVIVDDASTDETSRLVADFFGRRGGPAEITHTYERLGSRSGAPLARNRGMALAKGDAVMFVDSDDFLAPAGLAVLAAHLEQHPALDYAYGKVAVTAGGIAPHEWASSVGDSFTDAPADLCGYHWHTMGALYRPACLERVGPWDLSLSGSQDWEFQARVKLFGGAGEFLDCLVGYWRQHKFSRIGATSFRPDYVSSVMNACDSILRHARMADRCDSMLERRIARRLVVHALEWGSYGYDAERQRCLRQARECLSAGGSLGHAISVLLVCPRTFDRLAMRSLQILQGRG
jgi:glycosyltransferase involved in cell wall biosynthesis